MAYTKEQHAAYMREYRRTHPRRRVMNEKDRKRQRESKGCVDATGEIRHGACECCGKDTKLNWDHDHSTGKFRGWLCHRCNLGMSFLDQDAWLDRARAYLNLPRPP